MKNWKVVIAFFGFLAIFCGVVAVINLQRSPVAAFLFSVFAVVFFWASCFSSYEMGRAKELGRVLTDDDLEDNGNYQILAVRPLDANHRPYRSIAVILNTETKEVKNYQLRIVPDVRHLFFRVCRGAALKNFSPLPGAAE